MKNKKTFNKEFTSKIADLSRLKLSDSEIEYFTDQFNETLEIIKKISKLETKNVKEAYNVTNLKNVFREDEVNESRILSQKEALSNAKRIYNGFFVVKGIFNSES